jgi:Cu(I)/Ag(I) efflux system membrane fusion protein
MLSLAFTLLIGSVQGPSDSRDAIAETLATYEKIRSLLADDQFEGVPKEAGRLAKVAEHAAERSEGALKDHLKAASTSASALQQAKDLDKARSAFGDLSRHIVGAVRAEPMLARGRHVYKCPMVKEYGLWVQTSKEISNPYMGRKMLRCGEPAEKERETR